MWRVTWRRAGWPKPESKIFETEREAKAHLAKLERERPDQAPFVLLLLETRTVGPWRRPDVAGRDAGYAAAALDVLRRLEPGSAGVRPGRWRDAAMEAGVPKSTFYRHRKALVDAGLIVVSRNGRVRLSPA